MTSPRPGASREAVSLALTPASRLHSFGFPLAKIRKVVGNPGVHSPSFRYQPKSKRKPDRDDHPTSVRLPEVLRLKLASHAAAERRSLNAHIVFICQQWCAWKEKQ